MSWEERMASRAKERSDAIRRVEQAKAEREDTTAREQEQQAALAMPPPPCPQCWRIEFTPVPLVRATVSYPVLSPRTPFWDHFASGRDIDAEWGHVWVCDCECHPVRQTWPMIALA